jgi:hypothetical protein
MSGPPQLWPNFFQLSPRIGPACILLGSNPREDPVLNFFKRRRQAAPKAALDDVDLHLREIPGAMVTVEGFPRIDWLKVQEAVLPFAGHTAVDQIWTELAAQWLGILREHLGGTYEVYEGDHVLLLCPTPAGASRRLLQIADDAHGRLGGMLGETVSRKQPGKPVIIIPHTTRIYYDYIAYFYAEREQSYGTSAGGHISRGYGHIAINGMSKSILRTLVHELAHAMVVDRPLPVWVNEGLAQFVEDMVPGYRAPLIDARQVRLHRRYWTWFKMDHFWNGGGFKGASSQRLSYQLAEIIFRNLVTDRARREKVPHFLATVSREDAGKAACQESFNCTLSKLVEEFLGPGPWDPTPPPEVAK